nr:MAG TPA: hypothetical protein [Caudoviricetes sp.]
MKKGLAIFYFNFIIASNSWQVKIAKKCEKRRKNEALFCVLSDFFDPLRYFIPVIFW